MPTGFPDYYGGLTLPVTVPEGGTGQTSVTAGTLLYGAGTSKLIETNVGTAGQVLLIDPTSLVPTFETLNLNVASVSGILPIANGGTGTATPGLVAGAGISISGSWPDQTITNTDDAYFSSGILAIAHGGTGTSTPALTAGANISISGTWPNQTISLSTSPSVTSLTASMGITVGNDDLLLNRQNQTAAYITRPNITGYKTMAFAVSGGGNLDAVNINANTVTITGSLALGTPLAVAQGGTGTATPGLVAGAGISISGTWPNQTITNTDDAYFSSGILSIAHGGTGTSTPGLTAGAGISISGTWPNQTIVNSDDAYFTSGVLQVAHGGMGNGLGVLPYTTLTYGGAASYQTWSYGAAASGTTLPSYVTGLSQGVIGTASSWNIGTDGANNAGFVLTTSTGFPPQIYYFPTTGSAQRSLTSVYPLMTIDGDSTNSSSSTRAKVTIWGSLTLGSPLSTAYGGTGATSLQAAGIPQVIASTAQTVNNTSVNLASVSAPQTGIYRVSCYAIITAANSSGFAVNTYYYDGFRNSLTNIGMFTVPSSGAVGQMFQASVFIYAESGQNIYVSFPANGSGGTFGVAATVELL